MLASGSGLNLLHHHTGLYTENSLKQNVYGNKYRCEFWTKCGRLLLVRVSLTEEGFGSQFQHLSALCPWVPVGILPPHHESHGQVMMYRKDQFSDVLHALKVVRFVSDATPQVEVFLRMYQLESGKLPRSPSFLLVSSGHSPLFDN